MTRACKHEYTDLISPDAPPTCRKEITLYVAIAVGINASVHSMENGGVWYLIGAFISATLIEVSIISCPLLEVPLNISIEVYM